MKTIPRSWRHALVLTTIVLLPACALLKKPLPVTQLQLSVDLTALNWPAQIQVANMKARGVLQSDRIIVMEGAKVMQHEGVRWVDNPSALIIEQLAISGSRALTISSVKGGASVKPAQIEMLLTDFQIEVQANGDTLVVVALLASIRCKADSPPLHLQGAASRLPLNSSEPQRIAERFNEAALAVLSELRASSLDLCRAQ